MTMKLTLEEGIEKLKALFAKHEPAEPIVTTEQKFTDEKLNDGTTIIRYEAEELATGVVVSLIDEAGQVLPLPKGDYITEMGDTFTVVDDLGTIDNVVLVPAEEEVAKGEDPKPADPKAPVAASEAPKSAPKRVIKSQVEEHVFNAFKEEITKTVEELKAKLETVEAENVELKKQLSENKDINKEMFSVISQLSAEPAAQPTEPVKQKFSVSEQRQSFKKSMLELETKMTIENAK